MYFPESDMAAAVPFNKPFPILPRALILLRSGQCVIFGCFADIVAGLAGFEPGFCSRGRRLLSLLPGEEFFERLELGFLLSCKQRKKKTFMDTGFTWKA